MKQLILIICLLFTTCSFIKGQIQIDYHALGEFQRTPRDQKKLPSFIGGNEEFKRFFNEYLNMNIVADTNLKKGYVDIICTIDTLGNPKYSVETVYNKAVNREIQRVVNLITTKWNTGECLKNGSWIKSPSQLMILIEIPYKIVDGIRFFPTGY